MRQCHQCKEEKDESEFWKNKKGMGGLDWKCSNCRSSISKFYRENPANNGKGRPSKPVKLGYRWCSGCGLELLLSNFSENERRCRKCKRIDHLRRKYGLTKQEHLNLLIVQDYKCAICKNGNPEYVDHSHKTGRVRGLLCPSCNTAIGLLREDKNLFHSAIDYIARNEKELGDK